MSTVLRWTGNLLMLISLIGAVGVAYVALLPEDTPPPWVQDVTLSLPASSVRAVTASVARPIGAVPTVNSAGAVNSAITHVRLARIGLDVDVVPARLIEREAGITWEVPAFRVGHAESTAGAGEPGNAVLLGHVTSVRSGNVFQNLDKVEIGDTVEVFAEDRRFDYRISEVARVPRDASDVLEQGPRASVTLITCTGVWLPTIWDYTERLVVRAELAATAH
jgi:LPXTG-site transpeptidase (sortase) family protein